MAFKKLDLTVGAPNGGWGSRDKRIARITQNFQGGLIARSVAQEAIMRLTHGEDVREIETLMLEVDPVIANEISSPDELNRVRAEHLKNQGLAPRAAPRIKES